MNSAYFDVEGNPAAWGDSLSIPPATTLFTQEQEKFDEGDMFFDVNTGEVRVAQDGKWITLNPPTVEPE